MNDRAYTNFSPASRGRVVVFDNIQKQNNDKILKKIWLNHSEKRNNNDTEKCDDRNTIL